MSNFGFDSELKFVSDHLSCLQPSSIRGLVASWTSLLHFLLSLVLFNRSSNGIPVHSSMLSIQSILGFPCFLAPGVVPCKASWLLSPENLLLFLITCSKYDNFLLLIMLSSPRSIPAVSNTHSFVFSDTIRILRLHFISKASILRSSRFLMVQLSHPYVATGHTRAFMRVTLVVNFMPRLFPICFIPVSALCPLASFPLISLLHSASSAIIDPRY